MGLKIAEQKGLKDVKVFQLCESDAVAAYTQEEAKEFYQNLTGIKDDELYDYDLVEIVPMDAKIRKSEDSQELITVKEIVEMYWEGEPFIALSTGGF
ncbi:hypothetical protein [Sediminibacillus halophilus]|uniref:Uncharacterized protein n=1 Tax=Sediminibacillus halophilus TaxID=482461 RepID=A0A1G9QW26_9BACI|nr:hypothetical protein [Sediminibacillus halophilus]SDM15194.1 hypothetical protein SAMN05216244_1695 [Sediminibacillus halophilus]